MILNIGLILAQILGTATVVGVIASLLFDRLVKEKKQDKIKNAPVNEVWCYNHFNGCWELWNKE